MKFNKKNIFFLIIFIILACYLFITIGRSNIKQIAESTEIIIPDNAKLLFYKRTYSLNSYVQYVKFRMGRKIWAEYIKDSKFRDAIEGTKGNNVFSTLKIRFKNWEPQNVEKSVSGRYVIGGEYPKNITYLFDIQNNLFVDCYFAIYQE